MQMRIVKGQTRPGQVEELAKRWKEYFGGDRFKGTPGFHHAHFGIDRATNTTLAVTVWDTLPDESFFQPIMSEFRERVSDLMAGPPTVERYEVEVEL